MGAVSTVRGSDRRGMRERATARRDIVQLPVPLASHFRITVDLKIGLGSTYQSYFKVRIAGHFCFKPDDEYKQHRNTGRGFRCEGGRS